MDRLSNEDKAASALNRYSDMVYRICFMYMKNKNDADDAFQEIFLRYIRHEAPFESDSHEKAWICTVAFNYCKDVLKSHARKTVSLDDIEEPSCEGPKLNVVLEAVMQLPVKYKDVIYLYYYEDCTAVQIANILKCTENTVYSQLSRARQLLKESLGDDFED